MNSLESLIVLMVVVSLGSTLKCFSCNQTVEDCNDPFSFIGKTYLQTECEEDNMACLKVKISTRDFSKVARKCIPHGAIDHVCLASPIVVGIARSYGDYSVEVKCKTCTTDLCNSGMVLVGSVSLVGFPLAVKLFL